MAEFDIIRRLVATMPGLRDDVVVGPGDDGAVLSVPAGHELVLTTDALVAGRHFPRDTHAHDVACKALAVNLSDLAAMAARPAWLTIALTLPDVDESWLAGFASGLAQMLADSGTSLVGGDLTRGPLAVCVQAAGFVKAGQALLRDGARPGDAVCVTGTPGDAALGLSLWQSGQRPSDAQLGFLHDRLVCPQPRIGAAAILAAAAHAGVDLSDGLAADLGHVLDASGVGARIQAGRLPSSEAFDAHCPAGKRLQYQLTGGDDYELCLCLPEGRLASVRRDLADALGCHLTRIGTVESRPGLRVVNRQGEMLHFDAPGFDHFE